jgi:hypothetical protein
MTMFNKLRCALRVLAKRKESSSRMSTLAAKLIKHPDPDVRSLAASVLAQDETKGQRK